MRGAGDAPAAAYAPPAALVVLSLAGLYVGQSILSELTYGALPTLLRERGVALARIGLVYLTVLPWALKFLWAPAIERRRLPPGAPTRTRAIVGLGGLASLSGLALVAWIGPSDLTTLLAAFMVIAFAAATVDIACDGHAVETLARTQHGWGNAAQVGGAYLGAAIGSGAFLILVRQQGWETAIGAMAALLTIGLVNGIGGTAIGCLAALAGGLLVRIAGARPVLVCALALQAAALAGLAAAAIGPGTPLPVLVALSLAALSGLMALGFVALYSLFMGLSDPRQAGVDFTLLQCVDAALSTGGGLAAGTLAERAGFPAYFAAAAAAAILALPFAGRLARRVEAAA